MSEKLRCAVIGTGSFGLDHLHSLTTCHRAAAVAVAESHPHRGKESSSRYDIPRHYADYHELLEQPDIDAVTIALPNHLHAAVALEALKARKHVLVENPLALKVKETTKLIDTAKSMKRTLMVANNLRFDRHTQTAKALIERGDLGEVYHVRSFWVRRSGIPRIGSWYTQKQYAGGGCLLDLGAPLLDVCFHLLKEFDVTAVSAQTFAKFGPRGLGEGDIGRSEVNAKKPFDVEDNGVALLRLKSGRTIALEVGWAGFGNSDQREFGLDLLGTNAGLSLYPAKLFRNAIDGQEILQFNPSKLTVPEDPIHYFVGAVLDGKKLVVTTDESLRLQKIIEALYASAKSGKEVRLPPAAARRA